LLRAERVVCVDIYEGFLLFTTSLLVKTADPGKTSAITTAITTTASNIIFVFFNYSPPPISVNYNIVTEYKNFGYYYLYRK
jgi:hypothetical protein